MAATFDCAEWTIANHALTCAPTTFSAGRRINGGRQTREISNAYWRGPVEINPLFGVDMVKFRGFIASLRGSSGAFDLCICDPFAFRGGTQEEVIQSLGLDVAELCGPINGRYGLPFSDGTCFADGTGFDIPDFSSPSVSERALQGASSMTISSEAFLTQGSYFSTPDNYLHIIDCAPETSTIQFYPPLRRTLQPGEVIETQKPKIRVKLATDQSGTPQQNYGRYTDAVTLSVEEVLTR